MNRKQKMMKKTAKRAKARHNKHTPPTVKKYVSKGDRAKELAREQAEMAAKANELAKANDDIESKDDVEATAEVETSTETETVKSESQA
ncbi:DUF2986 domain-containing protein [Shewanella sp. Isolate11]|uniref:DUF2986 domain-containing protein n=1 Tax=Shewanella sp. Isolate11 TaxID=2908530 RepID=UPI001EFC60B8|nr:DUF2986 domain-containing protein [Shewanella sp. Isolate11]MCG9697071.1 DUF2986 domain-containing protein [Shewanella sp. Isolate11]